MRLKLSSAPLKKTKQTKKTYSDIIQTEKFKNFKGTSKHKLLEWTRVPLSDQTQNRDRSNNAMITKHKECDSNQFENRNISQYPQI